MANDIFSQYEGITRYNGVPTEQTEGRLHYNENLYGPSPKCFDTLKALKPDDLFLYESTEKDELIEAISGETGIPAENLFLNNGSAENIRTIVHIILEKGDTILLPDPGWSYYYGLCNYQFLNVVTYPILEEGNKCRHDVETIMSMAKTYKPRLIIITSPAMPTGNMMADGDIEKIAAENPESIVLIDEAYLGFADYTLEIRRLIDTYDNIVFSRTFSKYYGLANLRIGYGFCSTKLKSILYLDLPLHRLPHMIKRMAIAALQDKEYYGRITKELLETRSWMIDSLNAIPGVLAYESDANFIYIRLVGYDVEKIKEEVYEHGYLIRIFTGNEEKHLRITVGTKEDMHRFMPMLTEAISGARQ